MLATFVRGELVATINSVNSALHMSMTDITLLMVQKATEEDGVLVKLVEQIGRGFPESQHDIDESIREYHKFRHSLHVMDGVTCYKGRLIIPATLRKEILGAIHAAHQGVSSMNNRVEQSVFWPGITVDIVNSRHTCGTCTRKAPSQPAGKPVPPPVAEYPFQLVVGDYFSIQGYNYLVLGDRFSGWISLYSTGKGEFDGKKLEEILRDYFTTFNIPEEFSSDGGPQMMSGVVQDCLRRWGVSHRLSSAYFPHSNYHA